MRMLNPNTGEETVPVVKSSIFVYVTDYGLKMILKEIVVDMGQHHWEWVAFSSAKPIDIHGIGNRFSSFNNALNRAVNDRYCTVYEFDSFEEMIKECNILNYVDDIQTVYKSFESEESKKLEE